MSVFREPCGQTEAFSARDITAEKRADKRSPLWRIAGYIYETVISGSITIFSAKESSLISAPTVIIIL